MVVLHPKKACHKKKQTFYLISYYRKKTSLYTSRNAKTLYFWQLLTSLSVPLHIYPKFRKVSSGMWGNRLWRAGFSAMLVVRFDSDQASIPSQAAPPPSVLSWGFARTRDQRACGHGGARRGTGRSVVAEPEPQRQAQGQPPEDGCGVPRNIRLRRIIRFLQPIFACIWIPLPFEHEATIVQTKKLLFRELCFGPLNVAVAFKSMIKLE